MVSKKSTKRKIAIFGASDGIWGAIREAINIFSVDIVAFIDNDLYKQGMVFHGIPVLCIDDALAMEVEFVIIAAYSAMQEIINELNTKGVLCNRIAPFLHSGILKYNIGNISKTAWEASLGFYNEPPKLKKLAQQYIDQYEKYVRMQPFISGTSWNAGKRFISHACGGFVNGFPMMYTNSDEALSYTFQKDFQLMECDVCKMPDNEWILAHTWGQLFDALEYNYTPIFVEDLLRKIASQRIMCLFDIKWSEHDDYFEFVDYIAKLEKKHAGLDIKDKIILEVYDEETMKKAVFSGYQVFYTQYRNKECDNYMKTVLLCEKYGVGVVGFGMGYALNVLKKNIRIFTDKGIDIYAFSTDSIDQYMEFRKNGGYGVFTNYLSKARLS